MKKIIIETKIDPLLYERGLELCQKPWQEMSKEEGKEWHGILELLGFAVIRSGQIKKEEK